MVMACCKCVLASVALVTLLDFLSTKHDTLPCLLVLASGKLEPYPVDVLPRATPHCRQLLHGHPGCQLLGTDEQGPEGTKSDAVLISSGECVLLIDPNALEVKVIECCSLQGTKLDNYWFM